jgi:uncharacterized membrane protein
MMELVYFLGRFHVLALHIPIGLVLLALLMEVLSRRPRFAHLAPALDFVWLAAAISALGAVVLGYMHATEPGFEGAAVNAHRISGTILLALIVAAWAVRTRRTAFYAKAWPAFCVAIAGALLLTGHFGGNLTHGESYLVAYAPAPLRAAFGMPVARPRPTDVASADIYLDVVAPVFERRCVSCHNDGRKRGGLSLVSYATLSAGGEGGPAIEPGAADASELYRRITLTHDDEDFMPADGKTPPNEAEIAAIRWWIDAGAPASASVAALQPDDEVTNVLAAALGLRPSGGEGGAEEALPVVAAADERHLRALEAAGFAVRPVSQDSNLLDIDFTASREFTADDLDLLRAVAPQIAGLNLRNSGVTDGVLRGFSDFENLARLRLELNPVTAAGVANITAAPRLSYLNLYGTDVDDAVFTMIADAESLLRVYLWGTAVSDEAIDEFRHMREDVVVNDGFDRDQFPESPESVPVVDN